MVGFLLGLHLAHGGSPVGRMVVMDPAGKPVSGAHVSLAECPDGDPCERVVSETTGADGSFPVSDPGRMGIVAPGFAYFFWSHSGGSLPNPVILTPLQSVAGEGGVLSREFLDSGPSCRSSTANWGTAQRFHLFADNDTVADILRESLNSVDPRICRGPSSIVYCPSGATPEAVSITVRFDQGVVIDIAVDPYGLLVDEVECYQALLRTMSLGAASEIRRKRRAEETLSWSGEVYVRVVRSD